MSKTNQSPQPRRSLRRNASKHASRLTFVERVDVAAKFSTMLSAAAQIGALVVAAVWGYYQFQLGGADDWVNNITLKTEVLPYRDNLRLLVVHVKSTNPRNSTYTTDREHASFDVVLRNIPTDLESGATVDEDGGEVFASADIFLDGGYQRLPGSEFDDMATFVVPQGRTFIVTAEFRVFNGIKNTKNPSQDFDFNSASAVVKIIDPLGGNQSKIPVARSDNKVKRHG